MFSKKTWYFHWIGTIKTKYQTPNVSLFFVFVSNRKDKWPGRPSCPLLFYWKTTKTLKFDLYLMFSIWVFVNLQSNERNKREENMFVTKRNKWRKFYSLCVAGFTFKLRVLTTHMFWTNYYMVVTLQKQICLRFII